MNVILLKSFYEFVLNVQYIPHKSFYVMNVKYIQLNYICRVQMSITTYLNIFALFLWICFRKIFLYYFDTKHSLLNVAKNCVYNFFHTLVKNVYS